MSDVTVIYTPPVLAASDSNVMYHTLDRCMPRNLAVGGSPDVCALGV